MEPVAEEMIKAVSSHPVASSDWDLIQLLLTKERGQMQLLSIQYMSHHIGPSLQHLWSKQRLQFGPHANK